MPLPSFNFITEKQLSKENLTYSPIKVTVQVTRTSTGTVSKNLRFSAETCRIYDLDGKFVRLYGDKQKRLIGWSIIDSSMDISDMEDVHILKVNQTTKTCTLGIGKLLKSLGLEVNETLSGLEVKKHNHPLQPYDIHYIKIPAPVRPYKARI